MSDDPRLLVVDDEEAICEGCRRIFSRQGFTVQKTSDAREGLALASESDFSAILLDIKMPTMDGIQFLEQLRTKKPEVPVILMTGYPSVPSAVSAIRLGAAAFVTKPFTPEEITEAVRKHLRPTVTEKAEPAAEGWNSEGSVHFWHEAWYQIGQDKSARVGAMVMRPREAVESVRLPGIGEVVYQGLPMACLTLVDKTQVMVPSPISGIVEGVNETLVRDPSALLNDPCGSGWIATVCPTRLEEEAACCTERRVLLFNADAAAAQSQAEELVSLGCKVRTAGSWAELEPLLGDSQFGALVMSASGAEGLALLDRVNATAPALRVVVVASPDCHLEPAYRARKIFYYAVEPFADSEISDILNAAFEPHLNGAARGERNPNSLPLASVCITNRQGTKVRLLAAPGLLRRNDGLGAMIRQKLLDRLFPLETTSGDAKIHSTDIVKTAHTCDRLVVLLAKDTGRLPGSLVRDTKSQFIAVSGEGEGKVTTLVIQPKGAEGSLEGLEPKTALMLAEHIAADMASY